MSDFAGPHHLGLGLPLTLAQEQFSKAFILLIASLAGCGAAIPELDVDSVDWTLSCRLPRRPKLDLQIMAAACAAVGKRASYLTRKPANATDYLSGSQWVRPSGQLRPDDPMSGRPDPGLITRDASQRRHADPYERQVTRTLAEGLAALEQAARQAAASGGTDAFRQTRRPLGCSGTPNRSRMSRSRVS